MSHPVTPPSVLMNSLALTIKCLSCGSTFAEEDAAIHLQGISDPDTGKFIQYDVQFTDDSENIVYIQDFLCMGNRKGQRQRCSVFGRMADGRVFAFPCLTLGNHDTWHSSPDSSGRHFAMRWPAR